MIRFHFGVNDSFLRSTHPITIPRKQVDYRELRAEGLDGGDITVVLPHGEELNAQIYSGIAGWGPYYQIRAYSGQSMPMYLRVGDELVISLFRKGVMSHASLEHLG